MDTLSKTITALLVSALDAAGVRDQDWRSKFKINSARLARIRSGAASLTDTELDKISRATGEPWQNLVLGLLGEDNDLTADTRELVSNLHSLKRTAEAETSEHQKGRKHFAALRELLRKQSA